VFNVMRESAIAQYGAEKVHATFSDNVQPVLQDPRARDRHLVWKLHQADASWERFAVLSRARVVLTLRDPRDAALSLMQRFGVDFEMACQAVSVALRRVMEGRAADYPVLRYEDRFFDTPQSVKAIAHYMGIALNDRDVSRIFGTYTTEQVRAFGLALDQLPPERVKTGLQTSYDEVTQIHRLHIGDQRVGKWRDLLSHEQRLNVNKRFATYLAAFNYPAE
jgi:hypothetical protein